MSDYLLCTFFSGTLLCCASTGLSRIAQSESRGIICCTHPTVILVLYIRVIRQTERKCLTMTSAHIRLALLKDMDTGITYFSKAQAKYSWHDSCISKGSPLSFLRELCCCTTCSKPSLSKIVGQIKLFFSELSVWKEDIGEIKI